MNTFTRRKRTEEADAPVVECPVLSWLPAEHVRKPALGYLRRLFCCLCAPTERANNDCCSGDVSRRSTGWRRACRSNQRFRLSVVGEICMHCSFDTYIHKSCQQQKKYFLSRNKVVHCCTAVADRTSGGALFRITAAVWCGCCFDSALFPISGGEAGGLAKVKITRQHFVCERD